MHKLICALFFTTGISLGLSAQDSTRRFQGQAPISAVSTVSKPIDKQERKVFAVGSGIYFSNDFKGGRLNAVRLENDTLVSLLINPETLPVNQSPWYAFKVWSDTPKQVTLKLRYAKNVKHRYHPKISRDGDSWEALPGWLADDRLTYSFRLTLSADTLVVAAQPLVTTDDIDGWISDLERKHGVKSVNIGQSHLGKPIRLLHIGDTSSHRKVVVLGRQHPPEVTGHYALEAFVESLLGSDVATAKFRENFHVYVVPLLNPDGVDEGFWRHNYGGVDLNRDWAAFNQPESRAVKDYLAKQLTGDCRLYFAIDFHSTHDDIYYTVDPNRTGNLPGFVPRWLEAVKAGIPGYEPNVKPLYFEPPTSTAYSYLFETYGAAALVYEIGDGTPGDFIRKKSAVAAETLAQLLNQEVR